MSAQAPPDSTNLDPLEFRPESLLDLYSAQRQEQEVLGASQYAQKLSDAPAYTLVFTRQQLEERGYEDLSDLLRELPGVDVIANSGRFGEFYSIRGVGGNDRFLVLVDGRKLNAFGGTFLSVGKFIPLRFAERVEVIYGAASVIYGPDAFSGVINIIPKREDVKQNTRLGLQYGSFNSLSGFFETYLPINKNLSVNAFGRFFQSDGFSQR